MAVSQRKTLSSTVLPLALPLFVYELASFCNNNRVRGPAAVLSGPGAERGPVPGPLLVHPVGDARSRPPVRVQTQRRVPPDLDSSQCAPADQKKHGPSCWQISCFFFFFDFLRVGTMITSFWKL